MSERKLNILNDIGAVGVDRNYRAGTKLSDGPHRFILSNDPQPSCVEAMHEVFPEILTERLSYVPTEAETPAASRQVSLDTFVIAMAEAVPIGLAKLSRRLRLWFLRRRDQDP